MIDCVEGISVFHNRSSRPELILHARNGLLFSREKEYYTKALSIWWPLDRTMWLSQPKNKQPQTATPIKIVDNQIQNNESTSFDHVWRQQKQRLTLSSTPTTPTTPTSSKKNDFISHQIDIQYYQKTNQILQTRRSTTSPTKMNPNTQPLK